MFWVLYYTKSLMDVLGTLIYIIYLTKLEVCTSISIVDYIFEIKQKREKLKWKPRSTMLLAKKLDFCKTYIYFWLENFSFLD